MDSQVNEGFPPESIVDMTFGDLIHKLHPHSTEMKQRLIHLTMARFW